MFVKAHIKLKSFVSNDRSHFGRCILPQFLSEQTVCFKQQHYSCDEKFCSPQPDVLEETISTVDLL